MAEGGVDGNKKQMAEGGSKLSEEEIYECLKSFNVPVRLNDIKVPNREFIVRVFECFLRDFRVDITSPILRTWEATNHIEDPDLYEDTQLITLLAISVNHITSPCGLSITIKDIVDPKPKRTKKILNYLLVLWNYYIQKYARYHAMEESYEDEKKRTEQLAYENECLDEKYNDLLKTYNSMQPKEELLSIVRVKEEKDVKIKAECETLQTNYQALKAKEVNIQKQIDDIKVQILTARETLQQLSQRILSSPDRINAEIKNLEDRIKAADARVKEVENGLKHLVKKQELKEKALKEEETILGFLKETNDVIKDLKATVTSAVDTNQKIIEEENKVKKLLVDLERKEEEMLQERHKTTRVVMNSKKQVENLKEVLKGCQREEAELKKKVESLKIFIKNCEEDIESLEDKILDVIKECKEADAKSKEREAQFKARLIEVRDCFKVDSKEVLLSLQTALQINS